MGDLPLIRPDQTVDPLVLRLSLELLLGLTFTAEAKHLSQTAKVHYSEDEDEERIFSALQRIDGKGFVGLVRSLTGADALTGCGVGFVCYDVLRVLVWSGLVRFGVGVIDGDEVQCGDQMAGVCQLR